VDARVVPKQSNVMLFMFASHGVVVFMLRHKQQSVRTSHLQEVSPAVHGRNFAVTHRLPAWQRGDVSTTEAALLGVAAALDVHRWARLQKQLRGGAKGLLGLPEGDERSSMPHVISVCGLKNTEVVQCAALGTAVVAAQGEQRGCWACLRRGNSNATASG
jgi:hypothetical protein